MRDYTKRIILLTGKSCQSNSVASFNALFEVMEAIFFFLSFQTFLQAVQMLSNKASSLQYTEHDCKNMQHAAAWAALTAELKPFIAFKFGC